MHKDRPHNDQITDEQEGEAASYKLAVESYRRGRAANCEGEQRELQERRAAGGELLKGCSELLVQGFLFRATS